MNTEEIPFLKQLVSVLEKAEMVLEESYKRQDYNKFEQAKNMILKIQKEIDKISRRKNV